MISNFYVYVYLNPLKSGKYVYDNFIFNFEPFYVGKGKKFRSRAHLSNAKHRKRKSHLDNKILKIQSLGQIPIIIKIKENLTEEESWALEKRLITLIGRYDLNSGPLCNLSDGGEGQSGRIPWNKGKKMSVEICQAMKGRPSAMKGRKLGPLSKERKEKISEKVKEAVIKFRQKWRLYSPTGEIYDVVGLPEFCKEHNLRPDALSRIASGRYELTHRGWKCEKYKS